MTDAQQNQQPTGPTISDAYVEACQALGEEIVQRRLMAKQASAEIDRLTAERDDLLHRADHAPGSDN